MTDAVWLDETRELFIVGEWMPITIYRYHSDSTTVKTFPNTSGWWNTIHANDLDRDGKGNFEVVINRESGFAVFGEARDVKILYGSDGRALILVSRNNADPRLFNIKQ